MQMLVSGYVSDLRELPPRVPGDDPLRSLNIEGQLFVLVPAGMPVDVQVGERITCEVRLTNKQVATDAQGRAVNKQIFWYVGQPANGNGVHGRT